MVSFLLDFNQRHSTGISPGHPTFYLRGRNARARRVLSLGTPYKSQFTTYNWKDSEVATVIGNIASTVLRAVLALAHLDLLKLESIMGKLIRLELFSELIKDEGSTLR